MAPKGAPRHQCLAVCAPGVERFTAAELVPLGVSIRRTLIGGVEFSATDRQLYAANYWLRTANRVVVRAGRFMANSVGELARKARAVDWTLFIASGATPSVRVSTTASHLSHTDAIAETLAEVIGTGPAPGPLLVARVMHDRVTLSVDSSGDPLYQRGWRRATTDAPLRESLAAAVLMASGWDKRAPLLDPMCGSGTIAIEGALAAAGIPPGAGRVFAFMQWPSFAPGTWASVAHPPPPTPGPPITASDHDPAAVAATQANAQRAGVAIEVHQAPIDRMPVGPRPGWIITNPPYGKRLSPTADLRDLYAALGNRVRRAMTGWNVAALVPDVRLAGHAGFHWHPVLRTTNGGIGVTLLSTAAGNVPGVGEDT